ncbi:MAG: hypothetical protein IH594_12640 [Bacteroidales bacterium]|nr:hypothetical protein [Bacteroidales bacterium]
MEGEFSAFFDGVDNPIQVNINDAFNTIESLSLYFWVKSLAFTTSTAMTFVAGKVQSFRILMKKSPISGGSWLRMI